MNIVPGSSFFQTTSGSAAQPAAPRPSAANNANIQAQATNADNRVAAASKSPSQPVSAETPARSAPNPYGPRGSIIDIIA